MRKKRLYLTWGFQLRLTMAWVAVDLKHLMKMLSDENQNNMEYMLHTMIFHFGLDISTVTT